MTEPALLVGFDVGVPADWDVLNLRQDSRSVFHRALVESRAAAGRLHGTVDQAVAGYDAAARGWREQGAQWAAVLAERDCFGVLLATATLTLLANQGVDAAVTLAGLEATLAAQPTEAVRRFDLPAGLAIGVQRAPFPSGTAGVTVQLYLPVPAAGLLAVLTVTSPQENVLEECSVWALAIGQSLRWRLRDPGSALGAA